MDNNMTLYNALAVVPKSAQKQFNNGSFSGTDINPMWRIQMLTEKFGVCGIGWRYTIDKQWLEAVGEEVKAFCNISLYVKVDGVWSEAIQGTGGNFFVMVTYDRQGKAKKRVNDECFKMALTDALSVACKALGMGADIYYAQGRSKYTMGDDNREVSLDSLLEMIAVCESQQKLREIWDANADLQTNTEFRDALNRRWAEVG